MAKKNLQKFTRLSRSTLKNAEILFVHYLFTKSVPLFNNSNKEWVQKKFTLANGVSIRGFKWMVWSCFTIIVKFKIIITLYNLLSYLETPVKARLFDFALERTTSWIHNRQVRKSRMPRPNWDESRFPESSLIPFPIKIFSVFLNPAP